MFNIGELVIYSAQGICRIDDICEKTYFGVTRKYYGLHPIKDCKLKISIPVDNDRVNMLELIDKDEAEEIIESFKLPGISWIENNNDRFQQYSQIVKQGNRKEIYMIANTLIRRKHKAEIERKKFNQQDNKLLDYIQNILFTELAISMNTTFETINKKITCLTDENEE